MRHANRKFTQNILLLNKLSVFIRVYLWFFSFHPWFLYIGFVVLSWLWGY